VGERSPPLSCTRQNATKAAEAGETYGFEFDRPESRQEAEQEMPEFSGKC